MTGAARSGRRRGRAAPASITGAMALSAARRIVPEAISQGGRVSASPQSPGGDLMPEGEVRRWRD